MEQRQYRGPIDPVELAQHLVDRWDQGDTMAQALEDDEGLIVQIGQRTDGFFNDEPKNALTLAIEELEGGVRVTGGEQQWYSAGGGQIMLGGLIGFLPFFFTWPIGGGHDEQIDPQLTAQVWETIERYAEQVGGGLGAAQQLPRQPSAATGETTRLPSAATGPTTRLSEPAIGETTRLPSMHCPSCGTANPSGAERCRECGTFLQARNCPQCGVSNPATANFCMRCGTNLNATRSVG